MLKKICGLFLGLVVLAGSACVTPTRASSAPQVVLVHIQAASPQSAKDEFISIYNNSPNEVDITQWCITNKANVKFACFTPPTTEVRYYLPPYGFAVVVSQSLIEKQVVTTEDVDVVFPPSNASSGSIVNSNDVISLQNAEAQPIDTHSWSNAIPSGKVAQRSQSLSVDYVYETLDPLISWTYTSLTEMPFSQLETRTVQPVPSETEEEVPPDTPPITQHALHPVITELLPNPLGSDTGNEFIELFNPNQDKAIDLSQYKMHIGAQLEKSYSLKGTIEPLQYIAVYNSEVRFTLLNSTSSVQLSNANSLLASPITYTSPAEAESWAQIEDQWLYTNQLTPSAANQPSSVTLSDEESESPTQSTTVKPCAPNQYRSPETNRCRLLAGTATNTIKPCRDGYYRHAETNRCRKIIAQMATLTPCKEGQQRSPETNRCRKVATMTNADHGIKGVQTAEGAGVSWYLWLGIGGIVIGILSYAVWEWREELKKLGRIIRAKVAPSKE